MHSINLHVGSNLNLQLIYTLLILSYRLFSPFGLIALLDLWEGSTTFNELQLILFEREKNWVFKFDFTLN